MAGQSDFAMSRACLGIQAATDYFYPDHSRRRPGIALRELLAPLEHLLIGGGDTRLLINSDGCNEYGCQPFPSPSSLSFSSSTATPISARAFEKVARARESLLQSAIALGLDESFDSRIEAMRDELKHHLNLSDTGVEVIFSASGTDSQLHALFLTQLSLGHPLTTIIAAADQTGSGTVHTARGHHFSDLTANGSRVCKDEPIDGLAESVTSIALPSLDEDGNLISSPEADSLIFDAVREAITSGSGVLLQIMDSSKLGRRVPSHQCIQRIADRWPDKVQIVVDACQMRLGRRRIRAYLELGFMVLITGSKFFTGPPFSGALLVPASLSKAMARTDKIASGLLDYGARSDWPKQWGSFRSHFPVRPNFGQWLRWEAALEEIRAYFSVPDAFRCSALQHLGMGIARIIESTASLRLMPVQQDSAEDSLDDEELKQTTIFPFVIEQQGRSLSLNACKDIYRKLKAQNYLVGQPVGWNGQDGHSKAALRVCVSARHVTEAWSPEKALSDQNLKRALDRASLVVAKIESLLKG